MKSVPTVVLLLIVLLAAWPISLNAQTPPSAMAGRVLTPDGAPVPNATVSWVIVADPATLQTQALSTQTDASGTFHFGDLKSFLEKGAKGPLPRLIVQAKGWGLTVPDLTAGDKALTEIHMIPATSLTAKFVDASGQSIAGLSVRLSALFNETSGGNPIMGFAPLPSDVKAFARQTNTQGECVFHDLPQGAQARLTVDDDHYAALSFEQSQVQLGKTAQTQAKVITLTPGATVEGRVTFGPDKQPMPGVRVGAQQIGIGDGNGSATTDGQGRYHMAQLSPGRYNLALDLAGVVGGIKLDHDWTARAHENVSVVAGQSLKSMDFALVHGAIISGQVIGQKTGKPVPGLEIGLYGPAHPRTGAWVQASTTGPDGRFTLRVPDGLQYIYLMSQPPSGFLKPTAPPTGSVPISRSTEFSNEGYDLSVKDGQTVAVKWLLPEAAPVKPVQGRVLDAQGQPVVGADVLYAPQGEQNGFAGTVQTDAQGKFTLTPTSSQPLLLRAKLGGRATPKATLLANGGDITLNLQDHVLVSLKGRVVDSSGKPLADAKVNLITWVYEMGAGGETVSTDAEGRYAFSSLWPDARYSVDASLEGYGDAQSSMTPVKPGDNRELPLLTLPRADSFVAGRVVDAQGDPQASVTVGVNGPHVSYKNAVTDADGHFRIDGLVAADALDLWATLDTRRADKRNIKAGASDITLVLKDEKPAQKAQNTPAEPQEHFDQLLGKPAPALQAVAWVNGPAQTMAQLKGKVVLLDFWGVGCGPCVAMLPGVQRASEELKPQGVITIGLHNGGESRADLVAFAKQNALTYPLAIDASAPNWFGKTFQKYTVVGIPAVAVLDKSGNVAYLGNSLEEAVSTAGTLAASAL